MTNKLELLSGIVSSAWGLTFGLGLYGPVEAEVWYWGIIQIAIGLSIICISILRWENIPLKIVYVIIFLANIIMQIIPTILWFKYDGKGISDNVPPSDFIASKFYSIPHIFIAIVSLFCMVILLRNIVCNSKK